VNFYGEDFFGVKLTVFWVCEWNLEVHVSYCLCSENVQGIWNIWSALYILFFFGRGSFITYLFNLCI
jgi:hypothetical protein